MCFNRFHNYIAAELKEINEGGRFTLNKGLDRRAEAQNLDANPSLDPKPVLNAKQQLDEDLFQTARLYVPSLIDDHSFINANTSKGDLRLVHQHHFS